MISQEQINAVIDSKIAYLHVATQRELSRNEDVAVELLNARRNDYLRIITTTVEQCMPIDLPPPTVLSHVLSFFNVTQPHPVLSEQRRIKGELSRQLAMGYPQRENYLFIAAGLGIHVAYEIAGIRSNIQPLLDVLNEMGDGVNPLGYTGDFALVDNDIRIKYYQDNRQLGNPILVDYDFSLPNIATANRQLLPAAPQGIPELGDNARVLQEHGFDLAQVPSEFCCALSYNIMTDPVFLPDDPTGTKYEYQWLRTWLEQHPNHPYSRQPYQVYDIQHDDNLRNTIREYVDGVVNTPAADMSLI